MSEELIGKKGSTYPKVEEFSPEDRESFLRTTLVHAVGMLSGSDSYTDGNLTLEDLKSDQIQADWNEEDQSKVSYIKNKPTIPSIAGLASEELVSEVSGQIEQDIETAVSSKMDATESSAFYPREENPAGYLTEHQSLEAYATKEELTAATSAIPSAASLAGSGLTTSGDSLQVAIDPEGGLSMDEDLGLKIENKIPSTADANVGDVLTVGTSGAYGWAPSQGGGSGDGDILTLDLGDFIYKHMNSEVPESDVSNAYDDIFTALCLGKKVIVTAAYMANVPDVSAAPRMSGVLDTPVIDFAGYYASVKEQMPSITIPELIEMIKAEPTAADLYSFSVYLEIYDPDRRSNVGVKAKISPIGRIVYLEYEALEDTHIGIGLAEEQLSQNDSKTDKVGLRSLKYNEFPDGVEASGIMIAKWMPSENTYSWSMNIEPLHIALLDLSRRGKKLTLRGCAGISSESGEYGAVFILADWRLSFVPVNIVDIVDGDSSKKIVLETSVPYANRNTRNRKRALMDDEDNSNWSTFCGEVGVVKHQSRWTYSTDGDKDCFVLTEESNEILALPEIGTDKNRGKVLTVSDHDRAVWAPAQGGGSGDSKTAVFDIKDYADEESSDKLWYDIVNAMCDGKVVCLTSLLENSEATELTGWCETKLLYPKEVMEERGITREQFIELLKRMPKYNTFAFKLTGDMPEDSNRYGDNTMIQYVVVTPDRFKTDFIATASYTCNGIAFEEYRRNSSTALNCIEFRCSQVTPFDDNGNKDPKRLGHCLEYLHRQGIPLKLGYGVSKEKTCTLDGDYHTIPLIVDSLIAIGTSIKIRAHGVGQWAVPDDPNLGKLFGCMYEATYQWTEDTSGMYTYDGYFLKTEDKVYPMSYDPSGASSGDVVTYTGSTVGWSAPSGGGSSDTVIVNCTLEWISTGQFTGESHLHTVSMTPAQIISSIEDGKTVVARVISMTDDHVSRVHQIPMVSFIYLDGYPNYPIIEFRCTTEEGDHYIKVSNGGAGWSWEGDDWTVSDVDD